MSSRGVHFAITRRQLNPILKAASNPELDSEDRDAGVLELVNQIEERWDRDSLFETDKAWDGIHRCLTEDNTPRGRLNPSQGDYPLKLCMIGGTSVYGGRDYTITVTEPRQVADLAKALKVVDEQWMRERFFRLKAKATQYPIDETEFEYVWSSFRGLPEFFAKAAQKKRAVLFSVDH